jgi:hypothetical protein
MQTKITDEDLEGLEQVLAEQKSAADGVQVTANLS